MRQEGMFRDEALLKVRAGKGGDGCCSFHREKYVTQGGPDGGDGGRGGSIILEAVVHENSLFRVARMRQVSAPGGSPGAPNNCSGRSGTDVTIPVPVGTQVRDAQRGNLLADLVHAGQTTVVAIGGRGGKGNARFARPTDQTPRRFSPGDEGEARELLLELKLVADVGLVGLPNAGKSTLISRLTAARPRVAAYPFTTLDPSLGIMATGGEPETLVLADIPGLIEGASEGRGLGLQFLRHVERTRILLHLVDCSATAEEPAAALQAIQSELSLYQEDLGQRPGLVYATKVEDPDSEQRALDFLRELPLLDLEGVALDPRQRMISAVTGRGLDLLRRELLQTFHSMAPPPA